MTELETKVEQLTLGVPQLRKVQCSHERYQQTLSELDEFQHRASIHIEEKRAKKILK